MNREAMVETGAREIYEKCLSHGRDWRRLGPSGKEKVLAQSRAVLDAVLPQITSVEQFYELPNGPMIMASREDSNSPPDFYQWFHRTLIGQDSNDFDRCEPKEALDWYDSITVVWRP